MLKITTVKSSGFFLAAFSMLLCINVSAVSAQEKATLNRSILLSNEVEMPSNNINAKVIRVTFPPTFKTPWHSHEGPGPRYVVKGKLKVIEEGKTGIYSDGDVFWESGHLMSVENLGDEPAEIIIFELAPGSSNRTE